MERNELVRVYQLLSSDERGLTLRLVTEDGDGVGDDRHDQGVECKQP